MKKAFSEIYERDGDVRSHYRDVYSHWISMPVSERKRLYEKSKDLFSGDYHLDPLPRIITQSEFQVLQDGVEQRARAIRAFVLDYISGGTRYARVIPKSLLESIISRSHKIDHVKKIPPEGIAFPYGPDVMRDSRGRWRIIEDSAGHLGGSGDLLASHRILMKLIPEYRSLNKLAKNPMEYYTRRVLYFSEKARQKNGIPLLFLPPPKEEDDHESRRLAQIHRSLGVAVCFAGGKTQKLFVRKEGLYFREKGKTLRVGYLILHARPETMDIYHAGGWNSPNVKIEIDLSEDFRKSSCKVKSMNYATALKRLLRGIQFRHEEGPIQSALRNLQAFTNFSPGTQFINDKAFGVYVDSMIQKYLKQTPLIESIPTRFLTFRDKTGNWRADRRLITHIFRNKDRFVLKHVNKDGGQGVWIGCKSSKEALSAMITDVLESPELYVVQEFEHLSQLEDRIVDLRIHTHVDAETILMSNTPWGRANWVTGDGKVNLSSNGFTSPVFVLH